MNRLKYFLFFCLVELIVGSVVEQIVGRLVKEAEHLSITRFVELPTSDDFSNRFLVNGRPNKGNYSEQLNKIIRKWTPKLLAADPTSPFYFASNDGPNLLSYLNAVEKNSTVEKALLTVLPNSYRYALPIFSVFQCNELVNATENRFFKNAQLLVGPANSQLDFRRKPGPSSLFICSLYGSSKFIMVDSKFGTNSEQLLKLKDFKKIQFYMNFVEEGCCVFIPSDFTVAAMLNNSISLVLTLRHIKDIPRTDENPRPFRCSPTEAENLEKIQFSVQDKMNSTEIGLITYFYRYLNPPHFDKKFDSKEFFENFRNDKNISQFMIKWTTNLENLIVNELFVQVDYNQDGFFDIEDYKSIRKSRFNQVQQSIIEIFQKFEKIVVQQYNEFNENLQNMLKQLGENEKSSVNSEKILASFVESLPENLKEKLRETNGEVREYFEKLEKRKTKTESKTKRTTDEEILFETTKTTEDEEQLQSEEEEEEIIAEPFHQDL